MDEVVWYWSRDLSSGSDMVKRSWQRYLDEDLFVEWVWSVPKIGDVLRWITDVINWLNIY